MRKTFDEERLLRLDGKRPTARERWWAFYRLYRLAVRGGGYHQEAASECLHVLMDSGRWITLADAEERPMCRVDYPKYIRRRLLETDRRRRLFGPGYRWLDGCRATAAKLREEGTEVTPEEVAEVRLKIVRLARDRAAALGVVLSADDDKVLRLLKGEG